jgi:hypothetical protein
VTVEAERVDEWAASGVELMDGAVVMRAGGAAGTTPSESARPGEAEAVIRESHVTHQVVSPSSALHKSRNNQAKLRLSLSQTSSAAVVGLRPRRACTWDD